MTSLAPTLVLLAAAAIVLTGCTPIAGAEKPGDEKQPDSSAVEEGTGEEGTGAAGTGAKGPKCEDNTSGVELFSDPGVSESPEYGQVWGDGSPLTIGYDGFVEGQLGYQISYVQDNGAVIPVTGGFFPEPVGTTFTSSDPYFDSTSDGYYGIVEVDLTSNVTFDGEKYTGDHVVLGDYCVILATSE